MSWLGGYKPKPSTSAPDPREAKRKRLEEERNKRAQSRAAIQTKIQQAQEARQEADQALQNLLELEPDIFEGVPEPTGEISEDNLDLLDDSAETSANMPDDAVIDFEDENGKDDPKALQEACRNAEKVQ